MQAPNTPVSLTGEDDAICFTSGPSGAPFAAGVIHAWLAMDRKPPLVAAGISMGAISAAAMRRVYQELASASPDKREQKRWEWYRRYLAAIVENPTAAIWNSVPDPVDFFGNIPPVKDLSVPKPLLENSEDARRHYYLLTRLGVWLANLPVRLSTLATIVVMYVRKKEGYGNLWEREWLFHWNLAKAAIATSWHVLYHPSWIAEGHFKGTLKRSSLHPLFGAFWYLNLGVDVLLVAGAGGLAYGLHALLRRGLAGAVRFHGTQDGFVFGPMLWGASFVLALVLLGLCITTGIYVGLRFGPAFLQRIRKLRSKGPSSKPNGPGFFDELLRRCLFLPLDITQALLHPYEASRQLHDLFVSDAPVPNAEPEVHLLAVCAALEQKDQVLLTPDLDVVEALTAAIAIPGLFPPKEVPASSIVNAVADDAGNPNTYHLIDGAAIRTNPIPAFFEWCKQPENRRLVDRMEARSAISPSLHVVYNVPIAYPGSAQDAPPLACPDIVESAAQALQLEKRRDTRQEVRQTNLMSRLEEIRRKVTEVSPDARGPYIIYADEIAPRQDIDTGNPLAPEPGKLMQIVANGCRATIESLYRSDLQRISGGAPIPCPKFLAKFTSRRDPDRTGFITGLPEVCSSCAGVLEYHPPAQNERSAPGIIQSYGNMGNPPKLNLSEQFKNLSSDGAKVIFLGSGGVFRGAFHIGVIAAMAETQLYPDLVIGASVGALMGGALCHITAGPTANEIDVLFRLANLFLNVDSKVSLTRTLKNATKQLGTRARHIRLSPSELTRMVAKGSQADPGFAATGAPPALIDALSSLFMIPHRETGDIASQFVAGHVSEATGRFLSQLRKETLAKFDIKSAIMGVSLLADQARGLLGQGTEGVDLSSVQPFHDEKARKRVSFFCTTSFLNAKMSILLGRDFLTPNPTWDGVYAGLSSSAFPAVFAPRTEADFLPGTGRTDRYFADGGLFDNLPFFPAIEVLSAIQRSDGKQDAQKIREAVEGRASRPHLFIAAGLNAKPAAGGTYNTLFRIKARADSLSVESKTEAFRNASLKISRDLTEIALPQYAANVTKLSPADLAFLDGSVIAEVVSISPTDPEHINPTFAFCNSTGLKKQRVQESIADGCFQSLAEFTTNQQIGQLLQPDQQVTRIDPSLRVPLQTLPPAPQKACPFYRKGGGALTCPFTRTPGKTGPADYSARETSEVFGIWERCTADPAHRQIQSRWFTTSTL